MQYNSCYLKAFSMAVELELSMIFYCKEILKVIVSRKEHDHNVAAIVLVSILKATKDLNITKTIDSSFR